jgi:hypothetical protein
VVGTVRKVPLPVYAQQVVLLAFNQSIAAGGRCILLAGKQWLSYACLKQDRPVLVMCFYCYMIEEEVCNLFLVKIQVQQA